MAPPATVPAWVFGVALYVALQAGLYALLWRAEAEADLQALAQLGGGRAVPPPSAPQRARRRWCLAITLAALVAAAAAATAPLQDVAVVATGVLCYCAGVALLSLVCLRVFKSRVDPEDYVVFSRAASSAASSKEASTSFSS